MDDTRSDWLQPYKASGVLVPGLLDYVRAEQQASHIRHVSTLPIPGLFQTEQYARAVTRLWTGIYAVTSDQPEQTLVQFRLDRQWHLFERESPPTIQAIIDEAALLRLVGDRQTMYDQIVHLRKLADLPHIQLQILPLSGTFSYASAVGAISATHLGFADPARPEMLSVEEVLGVSYNSTNLHETRSFKMEFLAQQKHALSVERSRTYLEELAERTLTSEDRHA